MRHVKQGHLLSPKGNTNNSHLKKGYHLNVLSVKKRHLDQFLHSPLLSFTPHLLGEKMAEKSFNVKCYNCEKQFKGFECKCG